MDRRQFLAACGIGAGGVLLPGFGRAIAAEQLVETLDLAVKKRLADAAMSAAKAAGASYCDVRVGRYLRQFIQTREANVQGVTNTESSGVGVRVIAGGAWGFAATNSLSAEAVADTARLAVAIAKANAKNQTAPVQLAPTKGVGEVKWATPLRRNGMEVSLQEKVDLLMRVNGAALKAGANFVNSSLFLINEQKYFASTDGSYIDQDVHRIWSPFTVTAVDKTTGKFRSREGLSAPMGMGYEYLDPQAKDKTLSPNGIISYGRSYDMVEDAQAAAVQAREKLTAKSVKPGRYDLVLDPNHLGLTIHESIGHPLELDRAQAADQAGDDEQRGGDEQVVAAHHRLQHHRIGDPVFALQHPRHPAQPVGVQHAGPAGDDGGGAVHRLSPDHGHRRRRYAGGRVDAEQLFRLGGGGHWLFAVERSLDRGRGAGRLVGGDPVLYHVQGDEPQLRVCHPWRLWRHHWPRDGSHRRADRD